jgi:hypothetical protein
MTMGSSESIITIITMQRMKELPKKLVQNHSHLETTFVIPIIGPLLLQQARMMMKRMKSILK